MEINNKMVDDEYEGDDVHNAKDLELLDRIESDNDSDDDSPPLEHEHDYDLRDSDDETYDPAIPDHDDYF